MGHIQIETPVVVYYDKVLPEYDPWVHPNWNLTRIPLAIIKTYATNKKYMKGIVTHVQTHKWFGLVKLPLPIYTVSITGQDQEFKTHFCKPLLKSKGAFVCATT